MDFHDFSMFARPPGAQQGRQQGTKQTIKLPPPNQTNKQKCALFLEHFSCFNTGCQKEGQNEPRGLPKWSPKRPPGPPGRVKSRWEISPEAPRKITMNFFRPRGPPGASWEPPGEAPGAQLAPKRAPEASRSHFGTIWGAKMEPRGLMFRAFFEHVGALVWSPSPFALSGLAPIPAALI